MQILDKLTDDARQQYTLVGKNGEQISFLLYYLPTQQSWAFDISYNDFTANGLMLRTAPNLLRSWRHLLPFGLACTVSDNFEPYFQSDFITKRVLVYLLNSDEVAQIEADLFT